jgi:hypothetical protein
MSIAVYCPSGVVVYTSRERAVPAKSSATDSNIGSISRGIPGST